MNEQEARQILGDRINDDNTISDTLPCIRSALSHPEILLDGDFTADDLEAMAWWMRNKITKSISKWAKPLKDVDIPDIDFEIGYSGSGVYRKHMSFDEDMIVTVDKITVTEPPGH